MCLGIPGQIVALGDPEAMLATVDVRGVRRQINLVCIVDDEHPFEACVGDWVLDAATLDAALAQSLAEKAAESREANARFFAAEGAALVAAARALAGVYRQRGRLFAMGNGGSSCDAAHIAVEFTHPVTGRPALPAVNLVADTAMLSAVGNDVGFEHVFTRQVIAQARAGDGLIGVSTSGNSANLLAAFAKAKELGLLTIGLCGGDGGMMQRAGTLDHCLVVPSGSIHRIQECHVAAYHVLWDLVHTILADDRGAAATAGGR